jgi:hypothetical protein
VPPDERPPSTRKHSERDGRSDRRGALLDVLAEDHVHELSLMEDLLTAVTSEIGDARVHVVRLEVRRRSGASAHALRFCFEVCARGTPLEGATSEITETAGDELRLKELEVS